MWSHASDDLSFLAVRDSPSPVSPSPYRRAEENFQGCRDKPKPHYSSLLDSPVVAPEQSVVARGLGSISISTTVRIRRSPTCSSGVHL